VSSPKFLVCFITKPLILKNYISWNTGRISKINFYINHVLTTLCLRKYKPGNVGAILGSNSTKMAAVWMLLAVVRASWSVQQASLKRRQSLSSCTTTHLHTVSLLFIRFRTIFVSAVSGYQMTCAKSQIERLEYVNILFKYIPPVLLHCIGRSGLVTDSSFPF
jgi:hypothetical protein